MKDWRVMKRLVQDSLVGELEGSKLCHETVDLLVTIRRFVSEK